MLVKYANFGRLCAILLLLQTFMPQGADAKKLGGKTTFLSGALAGGVLGAAVGHIMTKQMQQQQQPIPQQQPPANPPPPPVPQSINQPHIQPMQMQFSYPAIQQQPQPQPQPAIHQQPPAWVPSYTYPADQSSVQHRQPVPPQFPQPAVPQLPAPVQQQSQPLQPAVNQHPYGWDSTLSQPIAQPSAQLGQSAGQYSPQFTHPAMPHLPGPEQPATQPPLQPGNSHLEQSAGQPAAQPGQTQFLYPPLPHLPESAQPQTQPQPSQAAAQQPLQPEHSQTANPYIQNVSESAQPQAQPTQPTQQPAERSLFASLIEKLRPRSINDDTTTHLTPIEVEQPPKEAQQPQTSGIQDSYLNIKTSVDQPHAPSQQQQQHPPQQTGQHVDGQISPNPVAQLPAPIATQANPVITPVSSPVQVPAQPVVVPAWHAPAIQPAVAIGGAPIQPGQFAIPTAAPSIPPTHPTEGSSLLSNKKGLFSKSSADKTQQSNFVLMITMSLLLLWFQK